MESGPININILSLSLRFIFNPRCSLITTMKISKKFVNPLKIIFIWALVVNIIFEFMFIFMPVNPFSRIGALVIYYETWGRRDYRNTIAVTPDELVGTWIIESSNGYFSSEQTKKVELNLHSDQSFEVVYPANDYSTPPSIPRKFAKPDSHKDGMIHLQGNWGIVVLRGEGSTYDPNCTDVVGRYEGEKEYVSLGQVLDRHVSSAKNRFAIKWWRREDESYMMPDYGIYLIKSHGKLNM